MTASKTHTFSCRTYDVILVSVRVQNYCKASAVIASLFPKYTPVFFRDPIAVRSSPDGSARLRKTFRVSKATFRFILCRIESDLQRRHIFTSGGIQ